VDSRVLTRSSQRDQMLLPVVSLCLLVATTAFLMVFTLLGQIGTSLHASRSALNWITIVTVIVGTISTGLFPALGSVLGQRRLMVISMGCLAVGSAISAAAPGVAILIAGRAIASAGLAAAVLSAAIVRERRSGHLLVRALAVIAAVQGVAAGTGFVLSGVVEDVVRADWRAVFWAMAALAALTAVLAAVFVPGGNRRTVRRIDVAGAVMLAGGLVAAVLPVTEGGTWGWTSGWVIGLFAAAVILLTAWARGALRSAEPVVDLRVLARPGVSAGAAVFLITAGTVGVINSTIPSFLQAPAAAGYGADASVLGSGLAMLPFAAVITLAAYLTGRLVRRVSPRGCAIASLGCEALALGLLADFHHAPGQVVALVALFGAGHGGALVAEYIMITRPVRPDEAGTAVSVGGAFSGIGGAVVVAAITPLLVSRLIAVGPVLLPSAAGYGRAWLLGAAVAVAGIVVLLLLPTAESRADVLPAVEASIGILPAAEAGTGDD
jgi:MFS family permease